MQIKILFRPAKVLKFRPQPRRTHNNGSHQWDFLCALFWVSPLLQQLQPLQKLPATHSQLSLSLTVRFRVRLAWATSAVALLWLSLWLRVWLSRDGFATREDLVVCCCCCWPLLMATQQQTVGQVFANDEPLFPPHCWSSSSSSSAARRTGKLCSPVVAASDSVAVPSAIVSARAKVGDGYGESEQR